MTDIPVPSDKTMAKLKKFVDSIPFNHNVTLVKDGVAFGVICANQTYDHFTNLYNALGVDYDAALETINILQDDNALLDIIDAQNDVLQGRVLVDEVAAFETLLSPDEKSDGLDAPTGTFEAVEHLTKGVENFQNVGSEVPYKAPVMSQVYREYFEKGEDEECKGAGSEMNWSEASEPDQAKIGQSQIDDMHRRISNQRQALSQLEYNLSSTKEAMLYWMNISKVWMDSRDYWKLVFQENLNFAESFSTMEASERWETTTLFKDALKNDPLDND